MNVVTLSLGFHIAAGTVALLTFWLPWVVKKGGALHRRVGWAFVGAMTVVSISGIVVSIARLLDSEAANDPGALFLFGVAVLSGANASMGIRSLRTKRRHTATRSGWDVGVAVALLLAGIVTLAVAWQLRSVLYAVFGGFSAANAVAQLRFWLRPPQSRGAWLYEHITGMGATSIAALTALLVVNLERFGLEQWALFFWIAPGVLGGIGIAAWQVHYRRKLDPVRSRKIAGNVEAG